MDIKLFLMLRSTIYLISLLTCISVSAQNKVVPSSVVNDHPDSILFSKVAYRLVGPFRGGRSAAVAGDPKQKNTFYFGATGGGVWKTKDGGSNWRNISDKHFGGSIGSIAIAPSDPTIMYVGEGENTLRGNVSEGFGMWRTDDGGRNWRHIGLKDTRHILRIVIHPKDPNTVWVAALGHLFGNNEERGIYKTIDGGKNWRKVLFADNQSGAFDLVMEPANPLVLYASTWTVKRTPYSLESGGKGSALWKSVNGGETWQKLNDTRGFPNKNLLGIIGIAIAPSNPDRVYAIVESQNGGLLRSEDAGKSWATVSTDANIRQRAWYFSRIFVDPQNPDKIWALNVNLHLSTDGGKTFRNVNTPHGDHHDMWIDPEDGNRIILADDGGAQVSFDGGANWSTYFNQPTAQFYRVSTDNFFPYRILGAQQDNTTVRILSTSPGSDINQSHWTPTAGFESGYVVADPLNPDIVYGGNYGGYISRLDHKTGENRAVSVWPDNPLGSGAESHKYRFQWNFPLFFSPHNPKKLYAGGNILFATENEGSSWTALSGDLTTNDKSMQKASGGPITKDNTGVETFCTIFTAAESVLEKDLLWTGSDDGLIHVSRDGGKNWQNVTPSAAGKLMMWNCVETDPFQKGTAYFVGTKYKLDDFTPYIFMTRDYGKSWTRITNGIPAMHFTRCLRADTRKEGILYAGTEYGMFISYNHGASWKPFQLNLPIVAITDMTIKNNDLVVATQGRGFWVIDDLSMVQEADQKVLNRRLHIFSVNDAYIRGGSRNANPVNAGMNPPNAVVINYFLRDIKDTGMVNISIFDRNKKLIRSWSTVPIAEVARTEASQGMNTFTWDMLYPPAEKVEGMVLWSGDVPGPKAMPGTYYARINIAGDSAEVPFSIKSNPNFKTTQQEYEEQFNFLLSVRDKFSEIQKGIRNIRDIRKQLSDFADKQGKAYPADIKAVADTISKQLTSIEESLYQTKAKSSQDVLNYPIRLNDKISGLYDYAASGNYAPPKQVKDAYAELAGLADAQLAKLKRIIDVDLLSFNKMVREKELNVIGIKKE